MKIKFVPQNVELEIKPNQSILELAHDNGIHIQSVCKGVPSCAECRIQIVEGEYNVVPPSKQELNLIGTGWFVDRSRLSCQLRCFGDVTVDLSQQIEKEQNAKRPRGKFQKDPSQSNAKLGSVLFEDNQKLSEEDYNLRKAEVAFMEEEVRSQLARIKNRKQNQNPDVEDQQTSETDPKKQNT